MKYKLTNTLWGFLFIILGICYAGDSFNLWNFNMFFNGWWTLLIIIPCIFSIIENGTRTGNVIGLIIGLVLLLSAQGLINEKVFVKLIFPAILILIGIKIIFNDNLEKTVDINIDSENELEYTCIFTNKEENFLNRNFYSTSILTMFGKMKLDLMKSYINSDIKINVVCIFGTVNLVTPEDINIQVYLNPIFGKVINEKINYKIEDKPTIYIEGSSIFGKINIR